MAWEEKNRYRPFCSERCKMIDLGDWAAIVPCSATRGDQAVAAWFLLPVKFELNPADSAAAPTGNP